MMPRTDDQGDVDVAKGWSDRATKNRPLHDDAWYHLMDKALDQLAEATGHRWGYPDFYGWITGNPLPPEVRTAMLAECPR